ncbi:6461_t:CDS:2 [Funneliformis caledonium]|uniref:6461_t:CDS:1 n=1 Tax=Funneliformis caledonium TaxID=1117310 RepID=A0A9N9GSU4_9GLOM|nr:6461_t:CDS:2 [Funneliformis caledonium]
MTNISPNICFEPILNNILDRLDQKDLYSMILLNKQFYNIVVVELYKKPIFTNIKSFEKCSNTLKERKNYASYIDHLDLTLMSEEDRLEITDPKLTPFIYTQGISKLRILNVYGCRLLTNGFARLLASSNLMELIYLDLGQCVHIRAPFISQIVKNCIRLMYLGMQGMRLEHFVVYGEEITDFDDGEIDVGWVDQLAIDIIDNLSDLRIDVRMCFGRTDIFLQKLSSNSNLEILYTKCT